MIDYNLIGKLLIGYMLVVLAFNVPGYGLTKYTIPYCQDLWDYVQVVSLHDITITFGYVASTMFLIYLPRSWLATPAMIVSYLMLAFNIGVKVAAFPAGVLYLYNAECECPAYEKLLVHFYLIYNTVTLTCFLIMLKIF